MTAVAWSEIADLSDSELRQRLERRGVCALTALEAARHRSDPQWRRFIVAVLEERIGR